MYPFFVFDLDPSCTDGEVRERYLELVRRFPPDRSPEEFETVQAAYEGLKTAEDRLRTRLFYFDQRGDALTRTVALRIRTGFRRRWTTGELAELLKEHR